MVHRPNTMLRQKLVNESENRCSFCSWDVIHSNDFNLFNRCFRKLFRKERIHLLGMLATPYL